MNATITRIVDILFQDTVMNDEVQALHDEILRNCQDRYDDQLAQGKGEDEAVATVVESLKGMEDVIGAYPRKEADAPREEARADADNAAVRRIRVDLRDHEVEICESQTPGRFTMNSTSGGVELHQEGDTLVVTGNGRSDEKEYVNAGWGWLSQIFSFGSMGGHVTIGIPRDRAIALELHTLSGDVQAHDVTFTEASLSTTSGDIRLKLSDRPAAARLNVQTSSGDLTVHANAQEAELRSMSGDVDFRGVCAQLQVSSASGDVEASGDLTTVRMKSVSGDVEVQDEFGHLTRVDAASTSGDVNISVATADAVHAELSSISGDVHCCYPDAGPDAAVQIRAKSISGDVSIR